MAIIKKVLNSSVVLVTDDKGIENIVLDKGIGYGRKMGEHLEILASAQIFMPLSNPDAKHFLELLDSIPTIFFDISQEIIEYAEKQLNTKLNDHIYMSLTDHLHFTVERINNNMIITNRVLYDMKNYYPVEFSIGLYAIELMKQRLGIEIPVDEAANITFHIINAEVDSSSHFDAMRAAKLIGDIITLITYSLNRQLNSESLNYSRFVTHLQYFAQRFFSDSMLTDSSDFLYNSISTSYPKVIECAERVRTFILKEYNVTIPNEEVAYLGVHIHRLLSN